MTHEPAPDPAPAVRYLYRSARRSLGRDAMVNVYLVEPCFGSTVVARIEPLGTVHARIGEHESALRGLGRNLVSVGPWCTTRSMRHTRVRVRSLRK
jgi:hypothetical protein